MAKKPATAKKTAKKAAVAKTAAKKSAAGKKTAKKPAAAKKTAQKPAVAKKTAQKPAVAKTTAKKPAAGKVAPKKAAAVKPPPRAPVAPLQEKPKRAPRKRASRRAARARAQADPLGLAMGSKPAALSKLGTKYMCYKCAAKFYDLNRPEPLCPKCGADQREAPKKSLRTRSAEPEATARREARRMAPLLDDDEEVAVVEKDKARELDIGLGVADAADDDQHEEDEDAAEESDDDA
jgi:uncharacterized protein (TIGR02300 family)